MAVFGSGDSTEPISSVRRSQVSRATRLPLTVLGGPVAGPLADDVSAANFLGRAEEPTGRFPGRSLEICRCSCRWAWQTFQRTVSGKGCPEILSWSQMPFPPQGKASPPSACERLSPSAPVVWGPSVCWNPGCHGTNDSVPAPSCLAPGETWHHPHSGASKISFLPGPCPLVLASGLLI